MNLMIIGRNKDNFSNQRIISEAHGLFDSVEIFSPEEVGMALGCEGEYKLIANNNIHPNPSVVLLRLGPFVDYYTTDLICNLQIMGIPVINKLDPLIISSSKLRTVQTLKNLGLPVPKTAIVKKRENIEAAFSLFADRPLILKAVCGGQGIGVILCETKVHAKSILEYSLSLKGEMVIQEYLEGAKNGDYRIFLIGKEIVAAMKRIPPKGEFRCNIHRGARGVKVVLSEEIQQLALKVHLATGFDISGIDIVESEKGPIVLEINSTPGLEGIEKVTGINLAAQMVEYLKNITHH